MKNSINYSHFKFTFLLFALALLVFFISCDNNKEPLSDINRVSMKTLPQVKYVIGDMLNLSDMVITLDKGGTNVDIPFSSFAKEDITTEPQNGKVLEILDKAVTVKIGTSGKGLIQAISVTNDVTLITIKQEPKKSYINGQKLDLTDMVVTFTYENGDVIDYTFLEIQKEITSMPAHGENLSTSDKEVIITHINTGVKSTQNITVNRFTPKKAVLITAPTKTDYTAGEKLDLTGIVIRYTLNNNTEVDIVGYENYDALILKASPAHGEFLTVNDTQVIVKHKILGIPVEIPITVTP